MSGSAWSRALVRVLNVTAVELIPICPELVDEKNLLVRYAARNFLPTGKTLTEELDHWTDGSTIRS